MRRNIRITLAVLAAAAALAGCSQKAPGDPTPVETTDTKSATGTSTPTSEALSTMQPCDLVDTAMAARLAVHSPKDLAGAGYRACRWRAEGTANFDIAFFADKGVKDIVFGKGTVTDIKIGGHSGKREEGYDGSGSCRVSLGVTESSSVDFGSVAGVDTAKACKIAMDGATAVEPKLP